MTDREFIAISNIKTLTHAIMILQSIYVSNNGDQVIDPIKYAVVLGQLQTWQRQLQELIEQIKIQNGKKIHENHSS